MFNITKLIDIIIEFNQETKKRFSDIFSFLLVKIYLLISIVINSIIWIVARYIDVKIDDPEIPLHFNVDFGVDYYGNIKQVYIIPFLGLLFIIFNFSLLLIIYQHKDRRFITYLLLFSSIIVNLVLLNSIFLIYLISFR